MEVVHPSERHYWEHDWNVDCAQKNLARLQMWLAPFFGLSNLAEEPILEVGPGGIPVASVYGWQDVTLVEPLASLFRQDPKFFTTYARFPLAYETSILEWEPDRTYWDVICFNTLDHFSDPDGVFFKVVRAALRPDGTLSLFVHLHDDAAPVGHRAIDIGSLRVQAERAGLREQRANLEPDPWAAGWAPRAYRAIWRRK